uniref:Uncharacterized protein n=1 Tax=Anguilla anguilla TaxID=7936 RepID=A0A0E9X6J2_ANGAN
MCCLIEREKANVRNLRHHVFLRRARASLLSPKDSAALSTAARAGLAIPDLREKCMAVHSKNMKTSNLRRCS